MNLFWVVEQLCWFQVKVAPSVLMQREDTLASLCVVSTATTPKCNLHSQKCSLPTSLECPGLFQTRLLQKETKLLYFHLLVVTVILIKPL